ncbi:DUF2493 domain-containing protein [Acidiphilium sp. AL]|nr:DUF2493 domain-containing protein [Acidiphilium sp. AL]
MPGFASRNKIAARLPSSAVLRPWPSRTGRLPVRAVSASGQGSPVKAAMGAVPGRKAHAMTPSLFPCDDTGTETGAGAEHHAASPTAQLLDELALYGYRPGPDEPDPRPLPDTDIAQAQLADVFGAFGTMLAGTSLEDDLPDLLWSMVNLFHRKIDRIERDLDGNEQAQRRSQAEQNGSEVKSVELERLIDQGLALIERRNGFEFFRDHAAELFEAATGAAWRPRAGSIVNHRTLTAAMIDSRDFLAAKRRAETELLVPAGTRIAFTGGPDCNDHQRIWAVLDKARAKHPDMVLLHGGSPKGAERIAACWADSRKVAQVVFKPDWAKHRNAAPFKRNDQMLDALPTGLIAFPGSGISANLTDKARKLGIPVWRFSEDGAQ